MSRLKPEGGFVLTKNSIVSSALTLVREQYPSIQGQRYLLAGSIRVFRSSQSDVPGRSFSRRTRSRRCCRFSWAVLFTVPQPESAVRALKPTTPLSIWRRLICEPLAFEDNP